MTDDTPEEEDHAGLSAIETDSFATWNREIEAELAQPSKPKVTLTPEQEAHKSMKSGLIGGAVALVLSFTLLQWVGSLPAGILLLDVGMAYGLISLMRALCKWRGVHPTNAFIAALFPLMALPTLINFLAAERDIQLPLAFHYTIAPTALLLGLAMTGFILLCPRDTAKQAEWNSRLALAGWLLLACVASLFLVMALNAPATQPGTWPTFALTIGIVSCALLIQATAPRLGGPTLRRIATPPALALAATQLLDGTVSYLGVGNPFGWLARPPTEQVAISAWLIQWTGPGYIVAKWVLAILVVMAVERSPTRSRIEDPFQRAMLYLVIGYVGMGPAIFSTSHLFL